MELKKFSKNERSSFSYWFNHYLAFNYVAWKLGVWKIKWLLHDIEKPWMKLILRNYKKVQKWHRYHNRHHLQYGRFNGFNKVDWLGMAIDWECSRYTKLAQTRNAREEMNYVVNEADEYTKEEKRLVELNMKPILDHLGL